MIDITKEMTDMHLDLFTTDGDEIRYWFIPPEGIELEQIYSQDHIHSLEEEIYELQQKLRRAEDKISALDSKYLNILYKNNELILRNIYLEELIEKMKIDKKEALSGDWKGNTGVELR